MKKAIRSFIFTALSFLTLSLTSTQANGTSTGLDPTSEDTIPKAPLSLQLKPTIGLGTGMFTFYGDLSNNHHSYHPTVSRVGYDLSVSNPLTDYLDLSFYALFGRVGANERSISRNLNFEARITTGGMRLSYNFDHFLKEDRVVSPFISVGIESFEFLAKTDRYDKNGNMYHYWSDGSIRNMDENDPNAEQAIEIYRDYTYESDLRELNLDGFGKYSERSWAFPVAAGASFHISDKVDFKVGTSMHFTLTDLVDNITSESLGNRAGNSGNDKFLFTSFSINYNLQLGDKKATPISPNDFPHNPDFAGLLFADEDQDGTDDFIDECPGTPAGVEVNKKGCPLDDDEDGVANYLDLELNTAKGVAVDKDGVTLSDDYFAGQQNRFSDSTGQFADYIEIRTVTHSDTLYSTTLADNSYPTDESTNAYLLSLKNLNTELDENGEIKYRVGPYEEIGPALRTKSELEEHGFDAKVTAKHKNRELTDEEIKDVIENLDTAALAEDHTNLKETIPYDEEDEATFRVQIGAFSQDLSPDVFTGVPDLVYVEHDGLTKYMTGAFSDFASAAERKVEMLSQGYDGAFIVIYKNGERFIPVPEGDSITLQSYSAVNNPDKVMPVNKELITFRVQLGSFDNEVPVEMLDMFIELGNVEAKRSKGETKYILGSYESHEAAQKAMKEFKAQGITDAIVVGDFNGEIISAEQTIELLEQ